MTDDQKRELLDWVSACQSAYHIENTPGHRFGGLPGALQENREALVAYVEELLAAAHTARPAGAPSLLRPAGARPTICYCPPDKCMAPTMGGRQLPCVRGKRP